MSSYASKIVLDGASDVAISGNVFAGLVGDAIQTVGPSRGIVVTGNVSAGLNRRRTVNLTSRPAP